MSIKRKKNVTHSQNDYRWKQVEEYFIKAGYVCLDTTKDLRIWVDCVGNGRNIQYTLNSHPHHDISDDSSAHMYSVMTTHSDTGQRVYTVVTTPKAAVYHSRDNPRW